jgi:DNA polymerase-3 subunit delta'
MLNHERKDSHIVITSEIESYHEQLKSSLYPSRVVSFLPEEGEFKLEHAKAVIAESYISESQTKYLILGAKNYNDISQNALLKVLEEPPRNIAYIILCSTKSNLLPTIRSRLPLVKGEVHSKHLDVDLHLAKLDYAQVFAFLKEHARVSKEEAKELLQGIFFKAVEVEKLILTSQQLENFDKAYRLLELNSRAQNVLSLILMSFMREK